MADAPHGLVFPLDPAGQNRTDGPPRRSTTATGRGVVADALRPVDAVGARAAERETAWRTQYLPWFRLLVEAGLATPDDAVAVARGGLDSLHARMRVMTGEGDGSDVALADWPRSTTGFGQVEMHGAGEPLRELVLPYRGERLRGDDVRRRVEQWVLAGVVEPTLAEAVDAVVANPDWLRLEGHTVAVVGAGSEMGPLQALTRWGARVAAIDLPREDVWERVSDTAVAGAGTVVAPAVEGRPGADLLADVPALADWLAEQPGTLVLGNYVYADGATNVRVSTAVDELSRRLLEARDDAALAFLATPTDVFAVPGDAVDQALAAYSGRGRLSKGLGRPLRTVSGGRLLQRPYAGPADPGLNDSLVPQQGPNYALAKRLQRWRATVARHEGRLVSMNVAPPTRTRSVVKNRALAAAYAGAHRFGVEVFDPSTSNVLMAAMLVHDLHTGGGPRHEHPWQDEAYAAAHGGLWRAAYSPRSALGLAALLGVGGARG
ncbi:hypothetical protein BKA08_001999 [Nocardioides marinisabuli]|uniref:Uncharacterized protein n=1 Tax=Nocardioides marinisabuli TaxID=419476 RepID=A0A7Y9F1T0_9ACTN|nr:hypothetical protein [Nocardioides marinisabuli]NYD57761.1 hypothetical protein [Nocardioides marinisabuli]